MVEHGNLIEMTPAAEELGEGAQKAQSFMGGFFERFAEAEAAEDAEGQSFALTIREFDSWAVRSGYLQEMPDDHEGSSVERAGLVMKRNQIRRAINRAAEHGKHGWPAFAITVDDAGGGYRVRLISNIALLRPEEVVADVGRYLANKMAAYIRFYEEVSANPRLPAQFRMRAVAQADLPRFIIENCMQQVQRLGDLSEASRRRVAQFEDEERRKLLVAVGGE